MAEAKKQKQPTFDEMLNELEALNTKLESGTLSLEESLKTYEQGVRLTAQCNKLLKTAKLKIEELKTTQDEQ